MTNPTTPVSEQSGVDVWWRRRGDTVAAAMLVLHAALAWVNRAYTPGLFHDEAHYMLLSRSLRQLQYVDYFLVGSPVHSQYPPGTPALQALLSLPFGDRAGVLIAGSVICSVAALALFYDLIRRSVGVGVALTALGLAAVNPEILLFAGRPLSEAPFMLWSMLALWGFARTVTTREGPNRVSQWTLLTVVAAVFAALTRTAGVTLLAAVFLIWLMQRRWRIVLLLSVIGVTTAGGWLLWTTFAPAKIAGRSYMADLTVGELSGRRGPIATVAARVRRNVRAYVTQHLRKDLPQPTVASIAKRMPDRAPVARRAVSLIDAVVGIVLFAGFCTIGAVVTWKVAPVSVLYLLLYSGLMAVWPYHNARFYVPLAPLVIWFVITGAAFAAKFRRWLRPLPVLVAAGIGGIALLRDINLTRDSLRCPRSQAQTSPACSTETERGLFAALSFIRASLPDSAAVMSTVDTQLAYFTGRRSLFSQTADTTSSEALLTDLRQRQVDFVLVTPFRPTAEQYVLLLLQSCQSLELIDVFGAHTLLLRVVPAGAPASVRACDALRRYLAIHSAVAQAVHSTPVLVA